MLLGTLGASLLGNVLVGKGINRARKDRGIKGRGIVRSDYGRRSLNSLLVWNTKILSKWT